MQTNSSPTLAGLYAKTGEQQLEIPLKHTEVQAKISGNLSRVEVTQTFENPFTQPLEAVYVFPLPDEAAVDEMEIKIGERIIKGSIKKREEAQEIYQQARREGRTAGLLEQERDNIFTQSLANIQPGEQINVTIRYTDSLKFTGGNYEFVFPMVVGPRYIPGTPISATSLTQRGWGVDTDQVPDASRITPPVVPPEMRSGHDIGVTVEIDAGVPVQEVNSPSHQLKIIREDAIVRVQLSGEDTIPNKDLILRYQVSADNTQATVLTQADTRGGHFAIYLIPALEYHSSEIVPKDVVFLMDTSGSQHGSPLAQCKELMRRFINGLNPDDTFTIIDFSDVTTQLSPAPLANTEQNRTLAINYINQLQANGGTELLNGIRAVMNYPAASADRLRSIVLLTDGYIGNENEILAEVQHQLKPGNRLYSFGVGSSVNRFLLNRIAEIGRGTSQIIRYDEPADQVAEKFFRQINNPVLTNIELSWEGSGEVPVIYPSISPDLFAEQPLVLFGRKEDSTAGNLRIMGMTAGGNVYEKILNLSFEDSGNVAIAQLWGRARIKDLMKQMFNCDTTAGVEAVTETALTYQLLSKYTAFVAVSDEVRVDPESESISMQVPVEMPEGVSHEGVFGNAKALKDPSFSSFLSPLSAGASQAFYSAVEDDELPGVTVAFGAPSAPSTGLLLLDVTSLSLGVKTLGSLTTIIIPRNTVIPVKKSQIFTTAEDGQNNVEISTLTGEREIAKHNKNLGVLRLDGILPAPRGISQIEVTFEIDVNGILTVTAKDLGTGKEESITIKDAMNWPHSEIEKMVKDGEFSATSDRNIRAKMEQKYQISALPYPALPAQRESLTIVSTASSPLEVVSVTGLDEVSTAALTRQLIQLKLPNNAGGEIIFEFTADKGRVSRIMLDETASILKDPAVIEVIKRSLLSWRVPQGVSENVCLTLHLPRHNS